MLRGLRLLSTGLWLAGTACGRGSGEARPPVTPADAVVHVEATNNYALAVEIHAFASGINHRLGTVHPGMTGRFSLPPSMIGSGSVEFVVKPTTPTQGQFRSGPLLLAPGRTVDLLIAPQLFSSTATLRP